MNASFIISLVITYTFANSIASQIPLYLSGFRFCPKSASFRAAIDPTNQPMARLACVRYLHASKRTGKILFGVRKKLKEK